MKKINYGLIPGGRAGAKYQEGYFECELTDLTTFTEFLHNYEDVNLVPNSDDDVAEIFTTLTNGLSWVGLDVYGEGVIGFTVSDENKLQLKADVQEYFLNGD